MTERAFATVSSPAAVVSTIRALRSVGEGVRLASPARSSLSIVTTIVVLSRPASSPSRDWVSSASRALPSTQISRGNNDSNVLVIGAKVVAPELAEQIVATWLETPFKGGVHQRRLDQIAALEQGRTP